MPVYTTKIAVGKWENRVELEFFPANAKVNGKRYNAFGIPITHSTEESEIRRPYKIDETSERVYIMYDDDAAGEVPIFLVTKENDSADVPEEGGEGENGES